MKKFLIKQSENCCLVEAPKNIVDNLEYYQRKFDYWIGNRRNKHNYWVRTFDGTYSLCFGGDAFVDWLNQQILREHDNRARIVKQEYVADDSKLPILNL